MERNQKIKKIIKWIIIAVLMFLVLLCLKPREYEYRDGGSFGYRAFLYNVDYRCTTLIYADEIVNIDECPGIEIDHTEGNDMVNNAIYKEITVTILPDLFDGFIIYKK